MRLKYTLPFLLLTLVMSLASAVAEDVEWEAVVAAFSHAIARGDLSTIEDSLSVATKYVQKYPNDGRAKTYRGSLSVMKARELSLFWLKLSSLNHGLSWMDEGVSMVLKDKEQAGGPIEIDVRMIRGITSAQIPRLFGRSSVARADFLAVTANPHFTEMNQSDRASVFAWLAVLSLPQDGASIADGWLSKARAADVTSANSIWEQRK